jgi:hypothetical protein
MLKNETVSNIFLKEKRLTFFTEKLAVTADNYSHKNYLKRIKKRWAGITPVFHCL